MRYRDPLIGATLVRRYKRFLADVTMDDGEMVTVHCPNTGALLGCAEPGSRVWLSRAENPKRKYAHTWELVEARDGVLVGINSGRANALVRDAVESGVLRELGGYATLRPEVRYGDESSRADFLLTGHPTRDACYVEVKSVTAAVAEGIALFPDAVSTRGTRHLRELARVVQAEGQRALLCFCVQRGDVEEVRPADDIDPAYGQGLRAALTAGVEAVAYRAEVRPEGIELMEAIAVVCP